MNKKDNGCGTETVENLEAAPCVTNVDLSSEDDTAELPVLNAAMFADAAQSPADTTNDVAAGRAERWVRHVEGEVERLQNRWESLDIELAAANDRCAGLTAQVEQRDATIAELLAELQTTREDVDRLQVTVTERDNDIEALGLAASDRDEKLAAASRSLDQANARVAELEDRLQATLRQVDELQKSVLDERYRAGELQAEKETAYASNASLRSRLQDLENYIDGRREQWSEQQAVLKSLDEKVSSLETALANSEGVVGERDSSIAALELRIRELEREAGEIGGRHKERDAAYQETHTLLQERVAEVERLKAKMEERTAHANNAIEDASADREQLDVVRTSLAEKDATIHRLEADLGRLEAVSDVVEDQKRADQQTINVLQIEVAQLRSQSDTLTDALDEARARMGSLSEKLNETEQSRSDLRNKNDRLRQRISMLEAALEARAEIIAGFDASARRLNELGRNLDSLGEVSLDDERVPTVTGESQHQELLGAELLLEPFDIDEHIETSLALSDHHFEHINDGGDEADLAKLDIRDGAGRVQRRAMIELRADNGERPVHAISKPITTIGRAKSSDIRLSDAVISRTHAHLRLDEDRLIIEDAGSKNGVAVNAKMVERAALKHGDIISLGNGHFRYVELEQPAQPH